MRAALMLAELLMFATAPVPREQPATTDALAGVWAYSWGTTPGVMHLHANGEYRAWHGECLSEYAGCWWVTRDGRVIVWEYRVRECGTAAGPPVRLDFAPRHCGAGWILRAESGLTVTLEKP